MKTTLHLTKAKAFGFTLLEVMIVAGLIGALAAIAATAVIRARNRAASTTCISNLEQIARAKAIWAFENKAAATTIVTLTDVSGPNNYLKMEPVCPMNGGYTVGAISDNPLCTVSGHVLPP